jgi:branched-subunit amino acid aminotransferase/4-amino-4-deoxychorismate lyase
VQLSADRAVAILDGQVGPLADARLGLHDPSLLLGDGAFETVGVWGGRPFRLADHLVRLDASLAVLALPPAPREVLVDEVAVLLDGVTADAALRIHVTAGGTRLLTLRPPPDRPPTVALDPHPAPWVQPAAAGGISAGKTMSYASNTAAGRRARAAGADDALLVSVPDGLVLEGSTFAVLVVVDGIVHAPASDLGIIDSISRRSLLEVAEAEGLAVREVHMPLTALADADEVVISSSLRPATAVSRVGSVVLPAAHPVADVLARGLESRRRG